MASFKLYIAVWAVLVAATILEVVTRFLPAAVSLLVLGIVIIASVKALLIASFFQHLRYETKFLAILPISGLLVLSTLLIVSILAGA